MQNYEQIRLIMNWERDHYRLGNEYKNKLAKKPVEVVEQELAEIAEDDFFGRAKRRDED